METITLTAKQIKAFPDGSLTRDYIETVRTNGEGWRLLYLKMDNNALIKTVKRNLENCSRERSLVTYDYVLKEILVPLLLERLKEEDEEDEDDCRTCGGYGHIPDYSIPGPPEEKACAPVPCPACGDYNLDGTSRVDEEDE